MQLFLFDLYTLYQSLYKKYVPFTWKKIFENSKSIDLWKCDVSLHWMKIEWRLEFISESCWLWFYKIILTMKVIKLLFTSCWVQKNFVIIVFICDYGIQFYHTESCVLVIFAVFVLVLVNSESFLFKKILQSI